MITFNVSFLVGFQVVTLVRVNIAFLYYNMQIFSYYHFYHVLYTEYFPIVFRNPYRIARTGMGNVEVTMIQSFVFGQYVYDGFEIAAYGHYGDIVNNAFKAAIVSPYQVAIQLPAYNYTNLNHYEETYGAQVQEGHPLYCERTTLGHRENIQHVLSNPHLLVRIVVLEFPRTTKLSNAIFSPGSNHGNIRIHRTINSATFSTRSNTNIPTNEVRVCWKVHIEMDELRKVAPDEAIDLDSLDEAFALANLGTTAPSVGGTTASGVGGTNHGMDGII
jgi:hypothetical protein